MERLRSSAEFMQDIVECISTDLYLPGPDFGPASASPDDAFADGDRRALEPEFIAPTTNDEYESSGLREIPLESDTSDGFRDRLASDRSWWASDLEFADDAILFAGAVLEATTREWEDNIRKAAAHLAADSCGGPPRPAVQSPTEGYVRDAMLRALQRIRTALDDILPIALLPDPYEVEVASVADLWQHVDALRKTYQECGAVLSDVGRALHVMLVIAGADSRR